MTNTENNTIDPVGAITDQIEDLLDTYMQGEQEYQEQHTDSGNNHLEAIREGDCQAIEARFLAYCAANSEHLATLMLDQSDYWTAGGDEHLTGDAFVALVSKHIDDVMDTVLDSWEPEPGHIFSNINRFNGFVVESRDVGEIEVELQLYAFESVTDDDDAISEALEEIKANSPTDYTLHRFSPDRNYWYAYISTNAAWFAVLDDESIASSLAWNMRYNCD